MIFLLVDGGVIGACVGMQSVVVNMLIEVLNINRGNGEVEDRNARFRKMSLDRRASVDAGSFEADFVRTLGVSDVELSAYGIDDHVKEDRADGFEDSPLSQGIRVHSEYVTVGE